MASTWLLEAKLLNYFWQLNLLKAIYFSVGTGYFQDCQYFQGPAYPPGAYAGPLAYPCVTSIDDDTGVIISGEYYNGASWILQSSVWSYNFTSGQWKSLANTTFLQYDFNCIRVKLSSGKSAILVAGVLTSNIRIKKPVS